MFADPTVDVRRPNGGGEVAGPLLVRAQGRRWCGPKDAGVEQLIADVGLRPVRVGDIDAIDIDGVGRHA
jgi:hypothetical protein